MTSPELELTPELAAALVDDREFSEEGCTQVVSYKARCQPAVKTTKQDNFWRELEEVRRRAAESEGAHIYRFHVPPEAAPYSPEEYIEKNVCIKEITSFGTFDGCGVSADADAPSVGHVSVGARMLGAGTAAGFAPALLSSQSVLKKAGGSFCKRRGAPIRGLEALLEETEDNDEKAQNPLGGDFPHPEWHGGNSNYEPQLKSGVICNLMLTDLDMWEDIIYGDAFDEISCHADSVALNNMQVRVYILRNSTLTEDEIDVQLVSVAPQLRLTRENFVKLLRSHAGCDRIAINHFMVMSNNGETMDIEACRLSLIDLAEVTFGVHLGPEHLEYFLEDAINKHSSALGLADWLCCHRRMSRAIRLARHAT